MAVTPSGKDKILRWARVYVHGADLSGDARTVGTLMNEYGAVNMTGWSESVNNYLSDGRLMVGVRDFNAHLNDDTRRAYDQLNSATNNSRISFCFGGGGEPAVGDPAYLLPSIQMSDQTGFDGGTGIITASFMPDAGQWDTDTVKPTGYVLRGPTTLSATLTASSANSIDLGAAQSNGWHANMHVVVVSGGNFTMSIHHSTDDSAFAQLGAFSLIGDQITSEAISGSGTVNRYVAFNATRTAGSITVIVTFATN